MKAKGLFYLLLALIAIILTSLLYFFKPDFLNSIELKLKDARFRLRGEIEPDGRILIVAIDSKSIDELGRWPWDRRIIARLIENLRYAEVICLDMVFSEPSNPESDRILSDRINKSSKVITGYYLRDEETFISDKSLSVLRNSRIKLIKTKGDIKVLPLREFPHAELNIPSIKAETGFFNILPDKDGLIRKANLLFIYNGDIYPSLALQAIRRYRDEQIIVEIEEFGISRLLLGKEVIPSDESGALSINYYGKGGSFKTIPAVDLIKSRIEPEEFRGSLVFIGATEIGIADVRNTPFDPVMPGVEIHATVASNILKGHYLIYNSWVALLDIFFICMPVLLLAILSARTSKTLFSLGLFIFITILSLSFNIMIFKNYFLDLSVLYPFVSLFLFYTVSEAYRNLITEKRSRFLKKAFSSYVSPELVNIIIKNPDAMKLGGEKRVITVLFSDIRDFTAISEALEPERLVGLLNKYLDPMTRIVLKNGGMLDKYIGDAIMAIYNVPLELPQHAKKAVYTALEMIRELRVLNERLKNEGYPELRIGIGINTGEAIIGNMGTDIRFDYTAVGDTVNLASRLEGLNKFYGTEIIISSFTYQNLPEGEFLIRELDLIRVKGRKEPVNIYEVLSPESSISHMIRRFEEALYLYSKRRFIEAEVIFREIFNKFNDRASMVFMERCKNYILNPPPEDWDGVYTAVQK
ncbi:MAG: adenylate/guanylate cyclase domain-containing protein [Thermodesulfovibrionales bacterium]|nr:adenylate/guanylate cyclase domain-containing protein [Thermodesulfovibrionales bacterium]